MVTIKVKENSKQAKAIIEMLKTFSFVEFVDDSKNEKSPYDPKFVAKILKAQKEITTGNTLVLNPNDIWGSLGLK